jgi:hypothetical protein
VVVVTTSGLRFLSMGDLLRRTFIWIPNQAIVLTADGVSLYSIVVVSRRVKIGKYRVTSWDSSIINEKYMNSIRNNNTFIRVRKEHGYTLRLFTSQTLQETYPQRQDIQSTCPTNEKNIYALLWC